MINKNLFKKNNLIIIKPDGGICSQIAFINMGRYFEEKGYKVKYDLSWFEDFGTDMDGRFVRNFDVNKSFKNLNLEIATPEEIKIFRKKYYRKDILPLKDCKPTLYITEWYPKENFYNLVKNRQFFKDKFEFVNDNDDQQNLLRDIIKSNSCGIHVRRGDIATSNCYGEPASSDYFLKAINIINKIHNNVMFYFFSDEMLWVKENIIPFLSDDIKYKLCDSNGSDKGYLDLYLLSKCKYIISSNGSFGLFAKILSEMNSELWMCKYIDYICAFFDNVYIIKFPKTMFPEQRQQILNI